MENIVSIISAAVAILSTIFAVVYFAGKQSAMVVDQRAHVDEMKERMDAIELTQQTRLGDYVKQHGEIQVMLATMAGDMRVIATQLTQIQKDRDLSSVLIKALQGLSERKAERDGI